MKLKKVLSLVILFALLIASCSPTPSPNQATNVEIQITGTEPKELGTQTISQNNCHGNAEVANSVEKSIAVAHTMEVQTGVSVNANG